MKYTILLLINMYLLLFFSCKKKCESNNLGNVSLSPIDLQIMPYKGTETLLFSDSLGDTLSFKGYWVDLIMDGIHNQYPNDYQCTGDYFYTESKYIYFKGANGNGYLYLDIHMDGGNPFDSNLKKYIYITFANRGFFYQGFYYETLNLYESLNKTQSQVSFRDSITLCNKKFYSVFELKQLKNIDELENLYIYYTIKEGVVGYKFKDGITWYLKN